MSWQLSATAVVLAALAAGVAWYEHGRPSSRLVAVVAALAALAVAGRVLLAPLPNVQATTDLVLLSGYALGGGPGFAVGAVGALASNVFLGQGPWTPWQMVGWGAIGVFGAALARTPLRPRRATLAMACALAGLAFGAWMDLFTLVNFAAERSGDTYGAIAAASLPFNVAHAIGNALLALALAPGFVRMLGRYRRRFEIRWQPAETLPLLGILAAVACATLAAGAAFAERAEAVGRPKAALRYLERAQNRDGGFGGAPGERSSQLLTGWTAIGLEAGGRNPLDVRTGGRSVIDFIRSQAETLNDTGELERTIIVLRGAGISARRFAGRDLVAELLRRRRRDGSWSGQVNWTSFGVLALRAAGRSARSRPVARAAAWIAGEQNPDGGFSFAGRGGASDVDDTGAALQALAVARRRGSTTVRRALRFLAQEQNPDGGFGQLAGGRSNAQSTAWAVQGVAAAGTDPGLLRARGGRSPLRYLASLQQGDGSFRYSRTSEQTPVWVTAQALAAVRLAVLPLRPVKRRRARRSSASSGGEQSRAARRKPPAARAAKRRSRPRAGMRRPEPQADAPSTTPAAAPLPARARAGDGGGRVATPTWIAAGAGACSLAAAGWLLRRRLRR
jgi:energy-coupling factor transport system substrate-specific component